MACDTYVLMWWCNIGHVFAQLLSNTNMHWLKNNFKSKLAPSEVLKAACVDAIDTWFASSLFTKLLLCCSDRWRQQCVSVSSLCPLFILVLIRVCVFFFTHSMISLIVLFSVIIILVLGLTFTSKNRGSLSDSLALDNRLRGAWGGLMGVFGKCCVCLC